MPVYRTYTLTQEGRIAGPPEITEYETDADAVLSVADLSAYGVTVEIWDGARLICCIKGGQIAAGPRE